MSKLAELPRRLVDSIRPLLSWVRREKSFRCSPGLCQCAKEKVQGGDIQW
uniref:Uncharacterized protein n=1 Tax=Pyricularia oryzae (strain P131) TaxID=1143193 RepID=L7ISG1_PYRO1